MALDGISRLIAVTQMKAENANTQASSLATKQIGTRQSLHEALHATANLGLVKTGAGTLDSIRSRFEDKTKDLESQDKLGNFEIQDLMSRYNQSETLASSVQKKVDDTNNSVIGKI